MTPSRAVLYGTAFLAAVAAHGAVVALLWSAAPAAPSPPAVRVRLIERPAPVAAPARAVTPTAVVAGAPEPEPKPKPDPKPKPEPAVAPEPVPPEPEPERESVPHREPASERRAGPPAEPAAAPRQAPGAAQAWPEPELALYCPRRPPPRYPAMARRLGQEGVVELQVELSATGALTGVRVVRSSGWPSLDSAAVAAVRGWRCDAPRVDGVAVAASARQRIRFSLR